MKTKRCMVVLFAIAFIFSSTSSLAFAAETTPQTAPATEQMSFDPLLYVTVLIALVLVCSITVSIAFYFKFKAQKDLICQNYTCVNNKAREEESLFDYRQIETPRELAHGHTIQSEIAVEEAIQRLTIKTPYTPRHKRAPQENNVTIPLPTISVVGDSRRLVPVGAQSQRQDVPSELEYLLQKIS